MDLSKSFEYLNPDSVKERIHVIGTGSVGSAVALLLARLGFTKISLYDFDTVSPHNLANQHFTSKHIGMNKAEAVAEMILDINPDASDNLKVYNMGYTGKQRLTGFVVLAVDSIELRKSIATSLVGNLMVKGMFDFRTRLTDAQHYAADWTKPKEVEAFINSMDFTSEEAVEATPMSACNVALCVMSTIYMVTALGVQNMTNFFRGEPLKKIILCDVAKPDIPLAI